ncbi:MAG: 4'-phosphopantetheinyl transferase family protein [Oscillospiraceae bacterium]
MCELVVVLTGGMTYAQAETYLTCVSAFRQSRIKQKRSDEDRLLSLAAGLLTGLELSRRTGIPRDKLRFTHGSFGKPYLVGSELQFSISHTRGAVCAAFSDEGEVGADIESRSRRVKRRLYDRVLSDREKLLVKSGEDFVRLWVQKEAFLKRLGTGIASSLKGADTTLLSDTAVFEQEEYLIGVSGKGADAAQIRCITLGELLAEYDNSPLKV